MRRPSGRPFMDDLGTHSALARELDVASTPQVKKAVRAVHRAANRLLDVTRDSDLDGYLLAAGLLPLSSYRIHQAARLYLLLFERHMRHRCAGHDSTYTGQALDALRELLRLHGVEPETLHYQGPEAGPLTRQEQERPKSHEEAYANT